MLGQLVTKTDFKSELQLLRQEMATTRELLSKDIQHTSIVMTIRLGSISAVWAGVLFTLLKLT